MINMIKANANDSEEKKRARFLNVTSGASDIRSFSVYSRYFGVRS